MDEEKLEDILFDLRGFPVADIIEEIKSLEADTINNEVALLKADVRRLEKLCKNMAEDYMKLAHPQLNVDDYDMDKPFTYEPLKGGIKRRPGIVLDKPLSKDMEGLKNIYKDFKEIYG